MKPVKIRVLSLLTIGPGSKQDLSQALGIKGRNLSEYLRQWEKADLVRQSAAGLYELTAGGERYLLRQSRGRGRHDDATTTMPNLVFCIKSGLSVDMINRTTPAVNSDRATSLGH